MNAKIILPAGMELIRIYIKGINKILDDLEEVEVTEKAPEQSDREKQEGGKEANG
jgi:hypothetical protein